MGASIQNYSNSEFIYHWQNLRNYTFYENRYEIDTFYENRYEIFVKNANLVPIFVKSVNFVSIFVKSVNFVNFVNGRWTHYKSMEDEVAPCLEQYDVCDLIRSLEL